MSVARSRLFLPWLTAAIGLSASTAAIAAQPATVVLVADRLIDGRTDQPRSNAVVLIEGERIRAVGGRDIVPAGTPVIELPGATLVPGMINAHEHPLMVADDYQNAHLQSSSAYKALMGLAAQQHFLLAGWTGVRVMGDADVHYANQDIRRAIERGVFLGPRLTGAGYYISITGGGGDINYLSPEQRVIPRGSVARWDVLDLLAHLTQHIPEPKAKWTRYGGFYADAARGKRRRQAMSSTAPGKLEQRPSPSPAQRKRKLSWARLIRKVFEVDPLPCGYCGSQMKIHGFTLELADRRFLKALREPPQNVEPLAHAPPTDTEQQAIRFGGSHRRLRYRAEVLAATMC